MLLSLGARENDWLFESQRTLFFSRSPESERTSKRGPLTILYWTDTRTYTRTPSIQPFSSTFVFFGFVSVCVCVCWLSPCGIRMCVYIERPAREQQLMMMMTRRENLFLMRARLYFIRDSVWGWIIREFFLIVLSSWVIQVERRESGLRVDVRVISVRVGDEVMVAKLSFLGWKFGCL